MTMEWQPIETAPRDGTLVDLWVVDLEDDETGGARRTDCRWYQDDPGWYDPTHYYGDGGFLDSNVYRATHWMLPPPPPAQAMSASGQDPQGLEGDSPASAVR